MVKTPWNTKESVIVKLTPDNFDGINNIQSWGYYIERRRLLTKKIRKNTLTK
jgi:hypothetical protein